MKHTKEHSTNMKGDLAEFYAVTWLWDNGYEVFKNCGCDGFIDLVARDLVSFTFSSLRFGSRGEGTGIRIECLKWVVG